MNAERLYFRGLQMAGPRRAKACLFVIALLAVLPPAQVRAQNAADNIPAGVSLEELRRIYDYENGDKLLKRPIWFTAPRGEQLYVAGVDRTSDSFVVKPFDRVSYEKTYAAITAATPPATATSKEWADWSQKVDGALAALAETDPGYGFIHQFRYNIHGIRGLYQYAPTFNELVARVAKETAAAADATQLNIDQTRFGPTIQALYLGNFAAVQGDYRAYMVVEQYAVKFSEVCAANLPPNKVEIRLLWTQSMVQTRGGVVVDSRVVDQNVVNTGVYATPEFAKAFAAVKPDAFATLAARALALGNTASFAQSISATAQSIRNDIGTLLARHGCATPTTKRLEDNLIRFVEGRPAYQAAR